MDVCELIRFLHPIVFGSYPDSVKKEVGWRLPNFTAQEVKKVRGSVDFLGLNVATATYAYDGTEMPQSNVTGFYNDVRASFTSIFY